MSENVPSPQPEPGPAVRSMADVARLFLDGARPTPEAGMPRRMGPQERAEGRAQGPSLPVSAASSPWNLSTGKNGVAAASPLTLPRVMLALTGAEDAEAGQGAGKLWLGAAASRLAKEHGAAIGILSLEAGEFVIEVAGLHPTANVPAVKASAGAADVQVARALFTLRHAVGHWMIAAPDADSAGFPRLAASVPDWLLITPVGNDHVVNAYQQLKRALAISSPAHDPLAVMLSADSANAGIVHSRLRRAAAEFLKKDLPLATVAALSGAAVTAVARIGVGTDDVVAAAVFAAVLDELCGAVDEADAEMETEEGSDTAPEFEDEIIELPSLGEDHVERGDESVESLEPFGGPAVEAAFDDVTRDVSIDIDGPLDAATAAAVDLALHADAAERSSSALFDQLTHVLDPEERDALSADLFSENAAMGRAEPAELAEPANGRMGEPAMTGPAVGDSSIRPLADSPLRSLADSPIRPLADSSLPSRGLTLHVQELLAEGATDRLAQWKTVEQSIRDLVRGSVLLDARPPMVWATESCLAVDGNGALHVWTLFNSSVSWFALKHWAGEHASLLALTRRDLKFDAAAGVKVHIILPLENGVDAKAEAAALLRSASADLMLYRMQRLEWGGRRGLLVVPLS